MLTTERLALLSDIGIWKIQMFTGNQGKRSRKMSVRLVASLLGSLWVYGIGVAWATFSAVCEQGLPEPRYDSGWIVFTLISYTLIHPSCADTGALIKRTKQFLIYPTSCHTAALMENRIESLLWTQSEGLFMLRQQPQAGKAFFVLPIKVYKS